MTNRTLLELLSPAKNLACGQAAVDHGADAVYIGGPAFGARGAAGNPVEDIAALAAYAHRYHAKVYVALNTLLRDDELPQARQLAWQLYDAGTDALIVQDMGLLELDLPPLALHASTQCDNRTPEKVGFLEQVGFSQVVLARELSLDQIRAISDATAVKLECFIHGALCVSYSGQCFLSHTITGRSANRGECAQPCRLLGSLKDAEGKPLAWMRHLLSLKDLNQTANLGALIDAGVSSFKIEGRLKDLTYVKNVTAHYRQALDGILEGLPDHRRASSGRVRYFFTPDPAKSFHRGASSYFLHGRGEDITSFDTPKFAGEPVGGVTLAGRSVIEVKTTVALHNGDGLCFFHSSGELEGFRINRVEEKKLFLTAAPDGLTVGAELYRNHDQEFEKKLEGKSAERKIGVKLTLAETPTGVTLQLVDEDGVEAQVSAQLATEAAKEPEKAQETLRAQLSKLGNTPFQAAEVEIAFAAVPFLPVSALNGLRREGALALEEARLAAYVRPLRDPEAAPPASYPATTLDCLGNVTNEAARAFYQRHGVTHIDTALELGGGGDATVPLMTTKHCLRHSFNLCPRQDAENSPESLQLVLGNHTFALEFDCAKCEMQVMGNCRKV